MVSINEWCVIYSRLPVDVTPFIFHIHTHISMVISSTVLGYEIEAVEFYIKYKQ